MTTAWKDLERRVCVALGGGRRGPTGNNMSDCNDYVPFAVQCKRSRRIGPPVLAKWIQQAKMQGKREKRPWLVVVAGHNDKRPVVTLDFWVFAQLVQDAGKIPAPLESLDDGEDLTELRRIR